MRCFLISHSTLNPNLDPHLPSENGHWSLLGAQVSGRRFQGSAPWNSLTTRHHLTLKTHPTGSPEATPQTPAPHFLSVDLPPPSALTHSRFWLPRSQSSGGTMDRRAPLRDPSDPKTEPSSLTGYSPCPKPAAPQPSCLRTGSPEYISHLSLTSPRGESSSLCFRASCAQALPHSKPSPAVSPECLTEHKSPIALPPSTQPSLAPGPVAEKAPVFPGV